MHHAYRTMCLRSLLVLGVLAFVVLWQFRPRGTPPPEQRQDAGAAWMAALQHPSRIVRFRAACKLAEEDATSTAGVAALIEGLPDRALHQEARARLVQIGAAAAPALGTALSHASPGVRLGAADILRDLGPAALPALPELSAALAHPHAPTRRGAARALAQLGPLGEPAAAALVAALADPDPLVRQEAALAAAQLTGRAEAVPVLFATLQQPARRDEAQQALMHCGPAGVQALTAALTDPDEVIRGEAARTLGEIGPGAQTAVPALIELLRDTDRSVRREAAHALGRIGTDAETSVPALALVLRDPWAVNRGEAAIALQRFGPRGRAAVPALVAALQDASLDASREAAKALVAIGAAAVPHLRQALAAADETLRQRAQEVLSHLEPPG